jgi:hypothetical protein
MRSIMAAKAFSCLGQYKTQVFFYGTRKKIDHSELWENFPTQSRGNREIFMAKELVPKALAAGDTRPNPRAFLPGERLSKAKPLFKRDITQLMRNSYKKHIIK